MRLFHLGQRNHKGRTVLVKLSSIAEIIRAGKDKIQEKKIKLYFKSLSLFFLSSYYLEVATCRNGVQ